MIQTSTFWLTLVVAVTLFWLLPRRLRYGFLAAISFAYLAFIDWKSVSALLLWSLAYFYLVPRKTDENPRRWLLPMLALGSLGYLGYFKYIPPLVASLTEDPVDRAIIIPLGISYFTFKFIHYALEVSRGNITSKSVEPCNRNG